LLELGSLPELGTDFREVACRGMATRAIRFEKCLAERGISGYFVPQVAISLTVGAAVGRQFHLHLQELRDAVDLFARELREGWHPRLRASSFDERANSFILLVMEYDHGSKQIRRLRATGVVTMASTAILLVQRRSFSSLSRVRRWAKPKKLARRASAASPTAASTPCSGLGDRLLCP
jgi:hypothetical protein